MDKNEIIEILIRRDGISRKEAEQTVQDCQNAIDELLEVEVASLTEAEDIISDYLGLEPDYLMAFLNY
jgi:hypothetical protein